MDADLDEHPGEFRHDKQIEVQISQQKLDDQVFSRHETNCWQCGETAQSDRPLQTKCCQKADSALIKIIVFTDAMPTSFFSKFVSKSFASADINVVVHQNNEHSIAESITPYTATTHFIVIKSTRHAKRLVDCTHLYDNVYAIYLQCDSNELKYQRRLARNYSKLHAVFDDPLRLLITLIMDIALFCEETADRQKEDASLVKAAHKNYQRSMDLYALAETLV